MIATFGDADSSLPGTVIGVLFGWLLSRQHGIVAALLMLPAGRALSCSPPASPSAAVAVCCSSCTDVNATAASTSRQSQKTSTDCWKEIPDERRKAAIGG